MYSKYFDPAVRASSNYKRVAVVLGALALVGVVATVLSVSQYDSSAINAFELEDVEFKNFLVSYSKSYSSFEEYKLRYQIFQDNLKKIRSHNAKQTTWTMGVNKFADLTAEEFISTLNYRASNLDHLEIEEETEEETEEEMLESPKSLNWYKKGFVTEVKDQASCGSCWAFSATGALESAWALAGYNLTEFSEQQLVDCAGEEYGNYGCEGGFQSSAFDYVLENGLALEVDYPYNGVDGECQDFNVTAVVNIKKYKMVKANNESQMLKDLLKRPLSVAVDASQWQFYESGIMTDKECQYEQLNHAVLLVGYGTEKIKEKKKTKNIDYWTVKNSWSNAWGEEGFIRLTRKEKKVHKRGTCGVAIEPLYPVV